MISNTGELYAEYCLRANRYQPGVSNETTANSAQFHMPQQVLPWADFEQQALELTSSPDSRRSFMYIKPRAAQVEDEADVANIVSKTFFKMANRILEGFGLAVIAKPRSRLRLQGAVAVEALLVARVTVSWTSRHILLQCRATDATQCTPRAARQCTS